MTTCTHCNQDFDTAEALSMHTQARHSETMPKKSFQVSPRMKKKLRNWGIGILVLILIVWGIYTLLSNKEPPNPLVPREAIHWHPTLKIIINGEEQIIPPNLGLGAAHLPIHTHDSTGVLHYENNNPSAATMKLGFFFERAWRKTFNSNCIFDYCNGPEGTVKMTVNDQPNSEFENFIPKGDDNIVIEYS